MEAVNQGFEDETNERPDLLARWETLVAQAQLAASRRRPVEATGFLERAYEMTKAEWPASRWHAESCVRLADLRAALDRRDDALRLYGEGIGILTDMPSAVNDLLAHAVSNMGRMYLLKGDLEKGVELGLAANSLQRKLDLPDTPSIKLNLAMAMAHAGNDIEAQRSFEAAVGALDHLEPGDPQGIGVYDNYALYCLGVGKVDRAETLMRHCLILRQEAAGPRHPLHAAGLVGLGRLLHLYGTAAEEAESLLWQAKEIYERSRTSTAPGMLSALYFLACIAQQDQRRADAGGHCNSMLELGGGDEKFSAAAEVASLHVTARLWAAEGSSTAETEKRLRQALQMAESLSARFRRLGVDMAANILADLSDLMQRENRLPEADRLSVRAAEMRTRLLWSVSGHVFPAPG